MKYDVLVAGASAAGMEAAITAARSGAEVILLDRSLWDGDHAANTLFLGMAARAEISLDRCYIKKDLNGMHIISPSGHSVTVPAPGHFIERNRFDEYYLKMAERDGVMLMKDEAIKIQAGRAANLVKSRHAEMEARVVIDASGVLSALASQVQLSPMRHPQDIAWAEEATVWHPDLGEEEFFQYWIGGMAPGWKATFSPAGGDLATIGVFVRGHGQDVNSFFKAFFKKFKAYKFAAYRDIDKLKILSVKKGGDPLAVLPGELVSKGFMVTGGAAGQSGLAYSMRAGILCGTVAAQAVAEGDVSAEYLSRYQRLWWSEFGWEYRMARASLETLGSLSDPEIDRLVEGLSGQSLVLDGSFFRKAIYTGFKIASVHPRSVLDLAINLARG